MYRHLTAYWYTTQHLSTLSSYNLVSPFSISSSTQLTHRQNESTTYSIPFNFYSSSIHHLINPQIYFHVPLNSNDYRSLGVTDSTDSRLAAEFLRVLSYKNISGETWHILPEVHMMSHWVTSNFMCTHRIVAFMEMFLPKSLFYLLGMHGGLGCSCFFTFVQHCLTEAQLFLNKKDQNMM